MSKNVKDVLERHREDECQQALRALLMQPLLPARHPDFALVRRHAETLREWLARETGWILHVDRDCARLYKRTPVHTDASRGTQDFDRRRYVLFCLACAILERADAQITLRTLGDRLLQLASEPALVAAGFAFTLETQQERRDLVAVCRFLLNLGVLQHVAGDDEDAYIQRGGDALYDIQRRVLAALPVSLRGPSSWPVDEAPSTLDERLAGLTAEYVADSTEGRREHVRHALARRLLDDPVVYFSELDEASSDYLKNQRGPLAARLADATGLVAEQRAEGVALIDPDGKLSDVALPAEGTEAHVTLLVAEFLANRFRAGEGDAVTRAQLEQFVKTAIQHYGRYWRKSAREPGAERELTQHAVARLLQLKLLQMKSLEGQGEHIAPLPALARFALGDVTLCQADGSQQRIQTDLFG